VSAGVTCRRCGEPILLALTQKERWIALEPAPTWRGDMEVVDEGPPMRVAQASGQRRLDIRAELGPAGEPVTYRKHILRCRPRPEPEPALFDAAAA
jgi:hypothetical protein